MSGMQGSPMGGGMPQLPPQVMQALMQHMAQQGGGGGMPPGPPQGMPGGMPTPPPMGGMPQMPGAPQGGPMAGAQLQPPGQQPMTPGQMAQQGRFGDSVVAHVTPGEISIPPQIQSPALMQAIRAAFAHFGISPQQFTAGSPQVSHNPATGAPELSLWSALLPIAGAALGSFIPGVGTAAGMAIGGGLGGAAGGLVDKRGLTGAALQGLGGAAGGYLGGALGGAAGGAASVPDAFAGNTMAATGGAAASDAPFGSAVGAANPFGGNTMAALPTAAGGAASATPAAANGISGLIGSVPWKGALAAGTGSSLAGMLTPSTASPLPPGFNNPLPPVNQSFNAMRGSGQTSIPQFGGYNPYTAVAGPNPGFNFYPQLPS